MQIFEAASYPEALSHMETGPDPDLVLMDLNMPGSEGPPSVSQFHQRYPDAPIVVISGADRREDIERVMGSGAMGFISKSTASRVMLNALRLVIEGGVYLPPQLLQSVLPVEEVGSFPSSRKQVDVHGLTSRQSEALTLLGRGLTNKEIAEIMGLAEGTVKIHVAAVYQVLHVSSRYEAMRAAERLGLVPPRNQ